MTATPIPRTLALTIYGDLAVSEIAKPPANRKPIVTAWVGAERSSEAYERLRVHLDAGRQAYVVCPLIEQSETRLARAAEEEAERLRRAELKGYRVGLLHGRLKTGRAARGDARSSSEGELDVLVATTVIEVGVDVPERDDHDRAGGRPLRPRPAPPAARPGRARGASRATACSSRGRKEELTDVAQARLQALVDTTDGFELAERRPRAARRGAAARHAPVRLERPALHALRVDRDLLEQARELARELARRGRPVAGRGGPAASRRATWRR